MKKGTKAANPTKHLLKDPVAFLVAPMTVADFWATCWEAKPSLFKATDVRQRVLSGVLTFEAFCQLLDAREESGEFLFFERDVNAMRYVEEEREDLNGMDVVDRSTAEEMFKAGATFQVHQPQRFDDVAWKLCAALEEVLGCLVGCNAYITPSGSQGLAPHYDDVELWVCQTSGTKQWRIYAPLPESELPDESSEDLPREIIGDPILEAVLKPGDVLYIPRGTIHEAVAQEEASSHITISSYQSWTWRAFVGEAVDMAWKMDMETGLPRSWRAGLPPGFLYQHGIQKNFGDIKTAVKLEDDSVISEDSVTAAQAVAERLREAAAVIEKSPQVIVAAADSMASDFMQLRLPPPPEMLPDAGPEPSLDSSVRCRGKNMFRLLISDPEDEVDEDGSDDEDEDEEESDDDEGEDDGDEEGEEGARVEGGENADKEKAARAEAFLAKLQATVKDEGDGEGDEGDGEGIDLSDLLAFDDEDDEGLPCKIVTCLYNDRSAHMMGSDEEDDDAGLAQFQADEDSEGDEPPYELVALENQGALGGKATKQKGADTAKSNLELKAAAKDATALASAADEEEGATKDKADGSLPKEMVIAEKFARAASQILSCVNGAKVKVRDLELEDDDEKLHFVRMLHEWGCVCTVPVETAERVPGKKGKKRRAAEADAGGASGSKRKAKKVAEAK